MAGPAPATTSIPGSGWAGADPGGGADVVLVGQVEDLLDAAQPTQGAADGDDRVEGVSQRHQHHEQEEDEGDQVRHREETDHHPVSTHAQHREEGTLHGEPAHRPQDRADPGDPDSEVVRALGVRLQPAALALGGSGGPDGADPRQGPVDARGDSADGGLGLTRQGLDPPAHDDHAGHRRRDDRQGDPQQGQVQQGHRDQGPEEDQRTPESVDQAAGQGGTDQGGVRAHPGDEVPGAAAVVLRDRQPEQLPQQPPAGAEHHALCGPFEQVLLDGAEQARAQNEPDQGHGRPAGALPGAHGGDDLPDQHRLPQTEPGPGERDDQHEDEHPAVLAQVGEQVLEPGLRRVDRGVDGHGWNLVPPYFLCTACRLTPSTRAIWAQDAPSIRALRTTVAAARLTSCWSSATAPNARSGSSSPACATSALISRSPISRTRFRRTCVVNVR